MALKFKCKVPNIFKSVKYCLAVVNGIFLLTGLALLILGIVVTVFYLEYGDLLTNRFTNISSFVIATGVLILLGSVLGFYAAISVNFYFVVGYVVLMLVVLVFEISIVISGFTLRNDAVTEIKPPMRDTLNLYTTRIEYAKLWDDLQMNFECCGVVGRSDYISNRIPVSCCHIDYGTISPFECNTANSYSQGCADVLGEWLADQAYVMAITALVFTCLQVLLTAMSGWMAWKSKFEEAELES